MNYTLCSNIQPGFWLTSQSTTQQWICYKLMDCATPTIILLGKILDFIVAPWLLLAKLVALQPVTSRSTAEVTQSHLLQVHLYAQPALLLDTRSTAAYQLNQSGVELNEATAH
jgi:hypothetical protein